MKRDVFYKCTAETEKKDPCIQMYSRKGEEGWEKDASVEVYSRK